MDVKTIKLGASDTDGNHCIYYLCPEHIAQHLDTKIKSLIDGKRFVDCRLFQVKKLKPAFLVFV